MKKKYLMVIAILSIVLSVTLPVSAEEFPTVQTPAVESDTEYISEDAAENAAENKMQDILPSYWILISLGLGFVIAFAMGKQKMAMLKTVRSQSEAGAYKVPGSFELTYQSDRMVDRTVTTRIIKKEGGGQGKRFVV